MLSGLHIFCLLLSAFLCPIYVDMMKRIKTDRDVTGHVVILSVFVFCFVSIILRNMI